MEKSVAVEAEEREPHELEPDLCIGEQLALGYSREVALTDLLDRLLAEPERNTTVIAAVRELLAEHE